MSAPRVIAIVLTWGRFDETAECLESLRGIRYESLEVLVVDNASGDDFVRRIRERFPDLEIVVSELNVGYAGGNNLGIARALEKGADFVLILNNDTVVTPDLVSRMVEVAGTDESIGAVGARVMQFENPERVYCVGGSVTWRPSLIELHGLDAPISEVEESRDMEMVPGCGVLLRSRTLEHVGSFDERFFAYHEDVDWCTRARQAGHRVVYTPDAVLYHRHAPLVERPRTEPHVYYFFGRNAILYARKHARAADWAKLIATSALWIVGAFFKRLVMHDDRRAGLNHVSLTFRGLADGLCRREIPYERLRLRPRPPY